MGERDRLPAPNCFSRGLSRYQINKMGAFTYADNLSSIEALTKAGFREVERFEEEEGCLSI